MLLDTLDRKILAQLQRNSRASLQEIGQAVGLSASPCWGRIKKMEEAGVIEGYSIRLNPLALGLGDTVLVQVTLDSHSDNTLEKFGELLASIPEVIEAHLVSGDYDYLLRVVVKDTRDYERLRVDTHRVALDHPGFLHLLDAPPARRRAQPHGLPNLLQAGAGVGLQYSENFSINLIHGAHYSATDTKSEYFSVLFKI